MTKSNTLCTQPPRWDQWQSKLHRFLETLAANPHLSTEAVEESRARISSYFSSVKGPARVVNAGVLNGGKSTLYNALCGKRELFPTADARRTTECQAEEFYNLRLIDTPGLDSTSQDEKRARETYRRSHIVLFVHSAISGELDAREMGFLTTLRELFPDEGLRCQSVIPVLTKCANASAQLDDIVRKVRRQWKVAMQVPANEIFTVGAKTHLKGIEENKPRLCEHSQVPALLDHVRSVAARVKSSQNDIIRCRINNELNSLDKLLEKSIEDRKRTRRTMNREIQQKLDDMDDDVDEFIRRHRKTYERISN